MGLLWLFIFLFFLYKSRGKSKAKPSVKERAMEEGKKKEATKKKKKEEEKKEEEERAKRKEKEAEMEKNLFELQIPQSPGNFVKPDPPKPAKKKKTEMKTMSDFSVQVTGTNSTSMQTEEGERKASEVEHLKSRIAAITKGSRIPRKHGIADIFHGKQVFPERRFKLAQHGAATQTQGALESTGIQANTTASSGVQTLGAGSNTGTDPVKTQVSTGTEPEVWPPQKTFSNTGVQFEEAPRKTTYSTQPTIVPVPPPPIQVTPPAPPPDLHVSQPTPPPEPEPEPEPES